MSRLTARVRIMGLLWAGRGWPREMRVLFNDFFVVHIARCAMFEPMTMQTPFALVEIN